MAMTEAEKKRVQRARKQAERKANADSSYPFLEETFSEFLEHEGNYSSVELALELAGISPPVIEDERGPEAFASEQATHGVEEIFPGAEGAVGRAEVIVDCLLDAATELAAIVNTYKRREIEVRLKELENSDDTDKAAAIAKAITLNKILEELNKQVRRSLPQWKVTDI
ncbi:hypothetical protein DZK27_09230 [Rhodobacteraceae bacterium 63075]|nr:hypothetical protein DZK27_09230 [Rhodobacteraceae bacterium 63075]